MLLNSGHGSAMAEFVKDGGLWQSMAALYGGILAFCYVLRYTIDNTSCDRTYVVKIESMLAYSYIEPML